MYTEIILILGFELGFSQSSAISQVISCKPGSMNSVTDFEDLTFCTTFVDKTLMIPAFFNNAGSRQFHLITCPRKFGKSTNINMMKKFVEMDMNENGQVKNISDTSAYRMFTDDRLGLKIEPLLTKPTDLFFDHFKAYSVVHLSFKNIIGDSHEEIVNALRENIKLSYESYAWLHQQLSNQVAQEKRPHFSIKKHQVEYMEHMLSGNFGEDDVIKGIFELTKIIYTYFNKKIFLLIDDYDAPVVNLFERGHSVIPTGKLLEKMYAKLLNPDHSYIKYAIITGTMNLFDSRFVYIDHYGFLDNHQYSEYFGFTDSEFHQLTSHHRITMEETAKIRRQFKGYITKTLTRLYNPYSVTNNLVRMTKTGDIKPTDSWTDQVHFRKFMQFLSKYKILEAMSQLLVTKRLSYQIKKTTGLYDLNELTNLLNQKEPKILNYQLHTFLAYLFDNGYLGYGSKPNMYTLPNREMETFFANNLYAYYLDHCDLKLQAVRDAVGAIMTNNEPTPLQQCDCESALEAIFKQQISTKNTFKATSKYHFQAIIYSAAKQNHIEDGEISLVDICDSKGRTGVFMIVEKKSKPVYVLELKTNNCQIESMDPKEKMQLIFRKRREQKLEVEYLPV